MIKMLKRSLIWIVSGSATLILTACYGAMMECEEYMNKTLKFVDGQGNPIAGLEVSHPSDLSLTDKDGEVVYTYCKEHTDYQREVDVKDIDGEENGSFEDKYVTVDLNEDAQSFTMDEKDVQ